MPRRQQTDDDEGRTEEPAGEVGGGASAVGGRRGSGLRTAHRKIAPVSTHPQYCPCHAGLQTATPPPARRSGGHRGPGGGSGRAPAESGGGNPAGSSGEGRGDAPGYEATRGRFRLDGAGPYRGQIGRGVTSARSASGGALKLIDWTTMTNSIIINSVSISISSPACRDSGKSPQPWAAPRRGAAAAELVDGGPSDIKSGLLLQSIIQGPGHRRRRAAVISRRAGAARATQ